MELNFHGKSPEEIRQILEDTADVVQHETYKKPLSEKEVQQYKELLAKEQVELFVLENQKKKILDDFKEKMGPKKEIVKSASYAAHYREIDEEGNVFQLREHDEGLVYYYSEHGDFLRKRPMRPDERQLTTFNNQIKMQQNG